MTVTNSPQAQDQDLAGARSIEQTLASLGVGDGPVDLRGADLSGIDLSGLTLNSARLTDAKLVGANLRGTCLTGADAAGVDLTGAQLEDASLTDANFTGASLGGVTATGADMRGVTLRDAVLSGADLSKCDLTAARLEGARMLGVKLEGTILDGATLKDVDLTESHVDGASFVRADFKGARMASIRGYRSARWELAQVEHADRFGAHLLRAHVEDENFIAEFRNQSRRHELIYWIWHLTSDCGRSVMRWSACCAVIASAFALLFSVIEIDYGDHETWLSPLYFSVVTLTTLGYGDAVPTDVVGQLAIMVEVVLGYVMLGGMLTLMFHGLSRSQT